MRTLTDEEKKANYEKLATQIVLQAIKDWKKSVKTIERTKNCDEKLINLATELNLAVNFDNITDQAKIDKINKKIDSLHAQKRQLKRAKKNKQDIERFFKSTWGETLSNINGNKIVKQLNENKTKILNLDLEIDEIN